MSITPPEGGRFSVDKYLRREDFPALRDGRVSRSQITHGDAALIGGREIAGALMYAAFRWVEAQGGDRVVAIGRREILDLYLHVGLERLGREMQSGAVTYELTRRPRSRNCARARRISRRCFSDSSVRWIGGWISRSASPRACFHGGAFFDAIGPEFDHLERRHEIINADVLDAWFPPSPKVIAALTEDLPWLLRTSPPTQCEGMARVIARTRGFPVACVLPGAGSSDLIFLAFRHWLNPASRVLILDPTYGEYAHVLEKVVGCRVDRLALVREDNYRVDLGELAKDRPARLRPDRARQSQQSDGTARPAGRHGKVAPHHSVSHAGVD